MGEKKGVGLDIGTNMLVSATMDANGMPIYRKERDAFFRLTPKSDVNRKSIHMALENRKSNYIVDGKDFIVVGEDALLMANERNSNALRPMRKGVLSPKEKDALPIMKRLIESLIGKTEEKTNLVFSIPAEPVDGEFDVFYHSEMMKKYIKEMGFNPSPINEAFAISFSELLDDNLTGMCISFGAGMVNTAVCFEGDPVIQFSLTRGGDWIDASVGKALDMEPSMIQIEKEMSNLDLTNPTSKIQEALSIYYVILMTYALDNIIYELEKTKLPAFREAMPVIVSGGLSLAGGFVKKFENELEERKFPFEIREVRRADDPMTCVAHGALMAAIL